MNWVPIIAWAAAVAFAVVVLGFCAYEIVWKAGRLQADLTRLRALNAQLRQVQDELASLQHRLTRSGSG